MLNVAMEQLIRRFNAIVRVSVTFIDIALLHISAIFSLLFAIEDPVAQFAFLWPNRLVVEDVLRASVAQNHERCRFELSPIFLFESLVRWFDHAGRLQELRQIVCTGVEMEMPHESCQTSRHRAQFAVVSHRLLTAYRLPNW